MMRVFKDRHDAGAQLAHALHAYADARDAVVLAHSRTSAPVAYEVAMRLGLPLEVLAEDTRVRRRFARGTWVERRPEQEVAPPPELVTTASGSVLEVTRKLVLLVDDGDAVRDMAQPIERLRAQGAAKIVAASAVAAP